MDKIFYKNILNKIWEKHSEYEKQEKMITDKIDIISVREHLVKLNKNSEDEALYKEVCNEVFSDISLHKLEEELKVVQAKMSHCKDMIRLLKEEYGIDFGQNDVLFDFLKPKKTAEKE